MLTQIFTFRHRLEKQRLGEQINENNQTHLSARRVDETRGKRSSITALIDAPSST